MTKPTRGRPRLFAGATVPVTVRVPTAQYDRMYTAATRARVTMAEWIRRQTKYDPKTQRSE